MDSIEASIKSTSLKTGIPMVICNTHMFYELLFNNSFKLFNEIRFKLSTLFCSNTQNSKYLFSTKVGFPIFCDLESIPIPQSVSTQHENNVLFLRHWKKAFQVVPFQLLPAGDNR